MSLIDSSLLLLAIPAMPPPPSWLLKADPLSEDEDGEPLLPELVPALFPPAFCGAELLEPSEFENGLELVDPVVIWPFWFEPVLLPTLSMLSPWWMMRQSSFPVIGSL